MRFQVCFKDLRLIILSEKRLKVILTNNQSTNASSFEFVQMINLSVLRKCVPGALENILEKHLKVKIQKKTSSILTNRGATVWQRYQGFLPDFSNWLIYRNAVSLLNMTFFQDAPNSKTIQKVQVQVFQKVSCTMIAGKLTRYKHLRIWKYGTISTVVNSLTQFIVEIFTPDWILLV